MQELLGNVVIIDTPGPNENTTTNFLKQIVVRELRRAAVILVVLDYTALNTEADEFVKNEIVTIRHASAKNDDSLVALVNKVDQRREGGMTPADVNDLVHNKFHIGQNAKNPSETCNVFEVQAFRASLSKAVHHRSKQYGSKVNSFQIKDLKSGSDFLSGSLWGRRTMRKTRRQSIKLIETQENSGKYLVSKRFLHASIEKLIEKAAPRTIGIGF